MKRTRLTEVWKNVPVKGYEHHYQISNLGRIKSLPQVMLCNGFRCREYEGKILNVNLHGNYKHLTLSIDGERKSVQIHKLVALAFIPNPLKKPQVNHKDGDKSNNFILNLEWATPSENIQHSFDVLGRSGVNKGLFGVKSNTNKKVDQYDSNGKFMQSFYSLNYAGAMTNVNPSSICKALKGVIQTAGGFIWKYHNEVLSSYADRIFTTSIRKGVTKIKVS